MNQNNQLKSHINFVQKMLQRAKGTEYEESYQNLLRIMENAQDLSDDKVSMINTTLNKLVQKLEGYKNANDTAASNAMSAVVISNENKTAENATHESSILHKSKKKKKMKKSKFMNGRESVALKIMSPRREKIPTFKIKLSDIFNMKRQKHEKRMQREQQKATLQKLREKKELTNTASATTKSDADDLNHHYEFSDCCVKLDRITPEEIAKYSFKESPPKSILRTSLSSLKRKSTEEPLKPPSPPKSVLKSILDQPSESESQSLNKPSVLKTILASPVTRSRKPMSSPVTATETKSDAASSTVLKSILESSSGNSAKNDEPSLAQKVMTRKSVRFVTAASPIKNNLASAVSIQQTEATEMSKTATNPSVLKTILNSSNNAQQRSKSNLNNSAAVEATNLAKNIAQNISSIPQNITARKSIKSTTAPVMANASNPIAIRQKAANDVSKSTTAPNVLKAILTSPQTAKRSADIPVAKKSHDAEATSSNFTTSSAQKDPQTLPNLPQNSTARKSTSFAQVSASKQPNTANANGIFKLPQSPPVIKPEKSPHALVKITNNDHAAVAAAPMVSIPNDLVFTTFAPNLNDGILLSAEFTTKKIRPWLDTSKHRKMLKNCEEMLSNGNCLAAIFKCMSSMCSYYTNQPQIFKQHLQLHKKYTNSDAENFQKCCYCNFENESVDHLIEHILNVHGSSKYQCPQCFYRCYDFHIFTHLKYIHNSKSEVAIECRPLKHENRNQDLMTVWKDFLKILKTITCFVCKSKFYNIANFATHISQHKVVPSFKCVKCEKEVNRDTIIFHLKRCHDFGNFNCAFCNYAADSLELIKRHLTNHHPEKLLFYFDRSVPSGHNRVANIHPMSKEDVSKVLVLKQLASYSTKKEHIKVFNNQIVLDNIENVAKGFKIEPN